MAITEVRNLEGGTEPEAMKEHFLLVYSPWLVQPPLYSIQDHHLRYDDTQSELRPLTSNIN